MVQKHFFHEKKILVEKFFCGMVHGAAEETRPPSPLHLILKVRPDFSFFLIFSALPPRLHRKLVW